MTHIMQRGPEFFLKPISAREARREAIMRTLSRVGCLPVVIALAVPLSARPSHAQRLEVQAAVGRPYGVGRIVVQSPGMRDDGSALLSDPTGRVYYPAYDT